MAAIDWNQVDTVINPKIKVLPFEQSKHLFTKVAFDVFSLNTSPLESLWTLEQGEDGKQYLVAMYDESIIQSASDDWNALIDKEAKNITLLYKNTPIQRFASTQYNFSPEDAPIFRNTLLNKLSEDKEFRNKFLQSIEENKRKELISQFPELA